MYGLTDEAVENIDLHLELCSQGGFGKGDLDAEARTAHRAALRAFRKGDPSLAIPLLERHFRKARPLGADDRTMEACLPALRRIVQANEERKAKRKKR